MAPTRPSKLSKPSNKAQKSSTPSKSKSKISRPPPKQQKTRPNLHNPSALKSKSKPKAKSKKTEASTDPATTTKAKPIKKRNYTDKQLNLPVLNAIVPANAAPSAPQNLNARGKKRKIFVDDAEGMATIMSIVQAEKEGDVEGKVQRMRKLEEIRANRVKEVEKKEGAGRGKEREEVVKELKMRDREKGKKKRAKFMLNGNGKAAEKAPLEGTGREATPAKKRKRVAFADV
jgi:60S ribosomal subunit assembly/export protein LOC1